jgi:hypothetical protein
VNGGEEGVRRNFDAVICVGLERRGNLDTDFACRGRLTEILHGFLLCILLAAPPHEWAILIAVGMALVAAVAMLVDVLAIMMSPKDVSKLLIAWR